MEKFKVINGAFMIVPNPIYSRENAISQNSWEYHLLGIEEKLKAWGQEISPSKRYVQIRVWSNEVSDWARNREFQQKYGVKTPEGNKKTLYKLYRSRNKENSKCLRNFLSYFPERIPVETLENLKEGDTLTLRYKDCIFKIKADQLHEGGYNWLNFQDMLKSLL